MGREENADSRSGQMRPLRTVYDLEREAEGDHPMTKPAYWGVFNKKSGKLMWWYDGDQQPLDRKQAEIFLSREDARSAAAIGLKNADEICVVKRVKIEVK